LLNNVDSAKLIFMVNVTLIESRNTSGCNHVLYKSLVPSAKEVFEDKIFVPLFNIVPKKYQNQNAYEETVKCKCCTKLIGSNYKRT